MKKVNGWWIPNGDEEKHHPNFLEHDQKLFDVIKQHSPSFQHAVDVGGNVGKWATELSKSFAKVSAFEPVDYHIECFEKNCDKIKNIDLYKYGLSDKPCRGTPDIFIEGHYGSTRILEDKDGTIELKTLDSLDFDHIDVLKIDVEGRELHVLQGSNNVLKNLSPLIVIERCSMNSNAFGYNKKDTHDLLESYGYKMIYKLTRDCVYKK